ncbi:hypothetical protein F4778DRAFT_782854 [Xylariomycetidae sp. FL2044]|nr:hypothetical protein F4778DRAFT_782854 [Xylariomycetidae sp. FL2044]
MPYAYYPQAAFPQNAYQPPPPGPENSFFGHSNPRQPGQPPSDIPQGEPHSQQPADLATPPSERQPQDQWINTKLDGIANADSGDLTVHLNMDIEEDLSESLEELSRLCRLGHFTIAKQFFADELQHHIDKPYVLVHYADMLLQQGNYAAVAGLDPAAFRSLKREMPQSKSLKLLKLYWDLMQMFARMHTLDDIGQAQKVLYQVVQVLETAASDDRPMGSTEIKLLGFALHLTDHPSFKSKWCEYRDRILKIFSPARCQQLYASLMREGRLWDLHDLTTSMSSVRSLESLVFAIFGPPMINSVRTLVSDWASPSHEYDTSISLALLSILTSMLLDLDHSSDDWSEDILRVALPIAVSIQQNDPASIKTRPYLRLLLAKSRFSEKKSRQEIANFLKQLSLSPGLTYYRDDRLLPMYVPLDSENPGWAIPDASSAFKDPVVLVARTAKHLGDHATEAMALREIIRLSSKPVNEFRQLCELQRKHQGDNAGYAQSLASKYLIADSYESREKLTVDIARLLSRTGLADCWNDNHEWILNMLLYKLQGRRPAAIHRELMKRSSRYNSMDLDLLTEVNTKFPALTTWVERQVSAIRNFNENAPAQQSDPESIKHDRFPSEKSDSDYQHKQAETSSKPTSEKEKYRPEYRPRVAARRPKRPPRRGLSRGSSVSSGRNQYPAFPTQPPPLFPSNHVHVAAPPPAPPSPVRDPEMETLREQLRILKENEAKRDSSKELLQLEERIRKETETAFTRKLEELRLHEEHRELERRDALEIAQREVELAKREARLAALEKKEAEERAEEARRRAEAEHKAQIERQVREQIEAERRAEAARERRLAEVAAEAEAAVRRAQAKEEAEATELRRAELRKHIEEEARVRAEAAARMELEVRDMSGSEKGQGGGDEVEEVVLHDPITFKDAVGRKFILPFLSVRKYVDMHELVSQAFIHVDGIGAQVQRGHYDLIGERGEIILPSVWEHVVEPGWHVSMNMWPMPSRPSPAGRPSFGSRPPGPGGVPSSSHPFPPRGGPVPNKGQRGPPVFYELRPSFSSPPSSQGQGPSDFAAAFPPPPPRPAPAAPSPPPAVRSSYDRVRKNTASGSGGSYHDESPSSTGDRSSEYDDDDGDDDDDDDDGGGDDDRRTTGSHRRVPAAKDSGRSSQSYSYSYSDGGSSSREGSVTRGKTFRWRRLGRPWRNIKSRMRLGRRKRRTGRHSPEPSSTGSGSATPTSVHSQPGSG